MVFSWGCDGGLTAQNGGFRPGKFNNRVLSELTYVLGGAEYLAQTYGVELVLPGRHWLKGGGVRTMHDAATPSKRLKAGWPVEFVIDQAAFDARFGEPWLTVCRNF